MAAFKYSLEQGCLLPGEDWSAAVDKARQARFGGFINNDGISSLGRMAAGALDVVGHPSVEAVSFDQFTAGAVPPFALDERASFRQAVTMGLHQLNPRTVEV